MTAPYVIHNRVNEYIDALPSQVERGYAEAFYRIEEVGGQMVTARSLSMDDAKRIRQSIRSIKKDSFE